MGKDLGTTNLSVHDSTFQGIYRGKVEDNNDPLQLGRIKVRIYPMLSGVETTLLPWAIPMYPIWDGSGSGFGYFAIPKVDSFVYVMFEQGDIYQPIYIGEAPTGTMGLPSERTTNYPDRKVIRTKSGIEFIIDDSDEEIKVNHPSGTYITVGSDGAVTVNSQAVVTIVGTSVSINPII